MGKTTLPDLKQNRTLKTKRWLGWLMFCMMMVFGHVGMAQNACEIEINLTFPEYGDGVEWELIDGSGSAVLTGGPYEGWSDYDFSINETHTAINPPYSLKIIIDDWGGYMDNDVEYSVTVGGVQDISGIVSPEYLSVITETFPLTADLSECIPSCPVPSTLSVSNITATAATLNWVSIGTSFDVELVTSGTAPTGTPTYTGVNSPFTTTTALSPSTAYQFYVRQNCGVTDGVSDWVGPFSFNTLCVPQTAPTVSENFTNYGTDAPTPLCWSEAKGAVTANSELTGSTSKWNGGNFANTGSDKGARVNLYGNQTGDWLISPQIDLGTTSGVYRVKYDMAVTNYSGTTSQSTLGTHIVRLIISTDGGETWSVDNSLTTYTGAGNYSNTGQTEVINLTDYSGIVKFAFVATTSSTSPDLYFFIDNFVIEEIPSCLEPADLTATDITATGATLSWVSDGSLFDIEIVESGEEPTGMPTYEGVTNNFTTTTPLTGSTTYNYWVRQDCGNDDLSLWAGPYSFTTLCVPVSTLPYIENFDTYGTGSDAFPLCWERPVTHTYLSVLYPSIVSGTSTSSPHSLRMMADPSTPTYAITPAFTEDINNLRVTFQLRREGANSGTVDFGVMSDPSDLSTFELVETIDPSNTSFNEYVFYLNETTLSGGNNHIAFKHNSNFNNWFIWIDDFVVDEIPSCFPPSDIEVDNITTYSAELTWVAPTMANPATDGYEIEIRTAGEGDDADEVVVDTIETTNLSATLSDLEPATSYTAYIKSLCTEDTDESVWDSISFVTACELPDAPANITFTDVTATATKVSFEAPAVAPSGYVIFRSTSDVPPVLVNGTDYTTSQTTAVASLTDGDNTYFCVYKGASLENNNASSLTSNTEYYYYVFSRSAENDCFGAPWYSELSLTDSEITAPATPTAAVVSNHTDTSATISWTASNVGGEVGAITYTLEVYTDSEYENPITGSPFTMGADVSQDITGLSPSTQYFFRIKANNTYHDSGYLTGNFTTTQVPATLDYEQYFEGTHGWALVNGTQTNQWVVGSATGNTGSSLYISNDDGITNTYTNNSTTRVQAYRDIAVPAGTSDATITFDWKGEGESNAAGTTQYDFFRVWLVPASYIPTAGTQISVSNSGGGVQVGGNFNDENDWTPYVNTNVDLSSFAGGTVRLVFEWSNDFSGGTGAAAIDNIKVTLPACPKPFELTATNITDESADLGWTSVGTTFDIKYGVPGFDVEDTAEGTLVPDFDNGETLSGLTENTTYEFYVRRDCDTDGESAWAGPFSFTTVCSPFDAPFLEEFSAGSMIDCWTNTSSNTSQATGLWKFSGTVDYATGNTRPNGTFAWVDGSDPSNINDVTLMTPMIDVSSLTTPLVAFDYFSNNTGSYPNNIFTVEVYDGTSWTQIYTDNTSSSSWRTIEIPLETFTGTVLQIRFIVDKTAAPSGNAFYNDILLDNVAVKEAPTCYPPLNIEVGSITKNSAEVTWEVPEFGNTPEDGYVIEIRTEGVPGEATGLVDTVDAAGLSATLANLEPSTSYTIYIKSLCTATTDESIWSDGVSFTTMCDYPDFELTTDEDDLILCGSGEATLEVDSDGIINWYDAADATEPIFTGTIFETDELSETTSFWFEAAEEGSPTTLGPVSPSAQGGTIANQTAAWNVNFTVTESTTLLSIDIFPNNLGVTGNIQLRQGTGGTVIETIPYTTSVSGGATAQTIELNFELEPGTYNLYPSLPSGGITRNTSGASYPYTSDVASITGNGWDQTFYMGFYNWVFDGVCKSPREEVVVTVNPIIDVTGAEVINITGPTATLVIESDAETFDIEYGETGFAQGTGTLVTEQESPYLIEGLTEDLVYDVYIRATESCGEWYELSFTATAPSEPQEITAEDVTKIYGDEPFVNGSSDSGLPLVYTVADEDIAIVVNGEIVITGAGTTEVTANQPGNSDYLPAEAVTFTLTITKAPLTVTAEDKTKVYDGEVFDENWTVTYEGFVYDEESDVLSGDLTYEGTAITAINGGTYEIEVSGLVSDNYEFTYEPGELTITKATLTGITFEDQTVIYDGNEKSIEITGNLPDGVTVTYTGNEEIEIGDYDVTAHIDGGTNFEDMELEALMLIRGVLTDITLDDAEFTYDGAEKTIEVTGDLPDGVTVTYTDNAQTEAGEYEVVANIEGGEFYSDLELTATLTINKATITGITFEDDTFTYDCTEHSLTIDGDLPTGATVSYIGNNQLSLGVHTVTAHIDGGNNYESFELTAEITIEELLPVITAQYACAQLVTADVEANLPLGWETRWYVSEDATDAVQTIESSGTYYVSSINGTCESSRIEVEVVVEDISIPTGETTQQFCDSASIEDIVVNHTTGANLNVYETATGGTALSAGTALFTGTFYIAEQIGDCESDRLAVQVTITQTPPAIAPATITICGFEVMANVEIGQQPNAELIWYVNETTPQPMNANTQVYSGTYYASQRIGICESTRTAITFIVNEVLPQPTASSQSFCTSAVVSDLVVTGAEGAIFRWFDSATSTDVLADNEPLSNGTYYVSQELNGCESNRKAISVQIINTAAPQIANMSICQGTTIAEVEIPATTGVTYKWYVSPTAITALPATTMLTNGTYFISSSYNGCESERVVVDIETTPVPNAPTGEAQQSFVYNVSINEVTIADLVVNEADVLWFAHEDDAATLTNPLESDMPLSDGTTYYAVIVSDNGCVSDVFAVTVTVTLGNNKFDRAKLAYYPNPTQGILNIQYAETIERVEIYNTIGQLVGTQDFSSNQITVDMGNLSNGTYLLKLHIDGYQQLIKVVKN